MTAAALEVRGVSRSFPGPKGPVDVLRGVDLRLDDGARAAIMGPSGAGKSTLLRLAGALDRCDQGQVLIAGQDPAALDDTARARLRRDTVGFVFQRARLLPQLTALENALLPLLAGGGRATPDHAARALGLFEAVGLADRTEHRPGALSGGEQQRVAVVRALIRRPRLLLADEPTGALDALASSALADLLCRLNASEGMALLVVTHNEDVATRIGGVLRLDGGRLAA